MMKSLKYTQQVALILFISLMLPLTVLSQQTNVLQVFRATVVDRSSGDPLAYAGVYIDGTNYTTVTNQDGEFSIKYSIDSVNAIVTIQHIGYKIKQISLGTLKGEKSKIELEQVALELPEISVISTDAESLVQAMFDKRRQNYALSEEHLTAFYRESIRKNKTYASLSEAVVDVYKQPFSSFKSDQISIYKSRKKTDYSKVDTLVFKLMGGPFNNLYLDLMKHPEMIFTEKMLENYDFTFDKSTRIGKRLIYVVGFSQKRHIEEPMYVGKLYIDAQSLALKSAVFNLNIKNKVAAAAMLIVKKPLNAEIVPTDVNYRVDFIEKNNKWYFGYSRIELGLRVKWKKKLFDSNFFSTIELAVTDKDVLESSKTLNRDQRLKSTVVIVDEASGFADPDFWGEMNVIEPEKPIETAIRKIQKQLERK